MGPRSGSDRKEEAHIVGKVAREMEKTVYLLRQISPPQTTEERRGGS